MNIKNIIKNPVIIGLVAGTLTYTYMKWKHNKDYKKSKNKNKKKKDVNLIIPLAVFIIFWLVSYAYFTNSDDTVNNTNLSKNSSNQLKNDLAKDLDIGDPISYKFSKDSDASDGKFFMTSKGIQIPKKLPSTLFEMN